MRDPILAGSEPSAWRWRCKLRVDGALCAALAVPSRNGVANLWPIADRDEEKNIRLSLAPVFQKRQVQTSASGRGLETLPQNAMRDCIFNSVLGFERMSSATKAWRVAGTRLPVGRGNRSG